MKSLDLSDNYNISLEGLRGLLQCMRNPVSSLDELILQNCGVNDEGIVLIMEKVAQSVSLKKLDLSCNDLISSRGMITIIHALSNCELSLECINLEGYNGIDFDVIDEEDWFSLLRAFCDKSSINNTFYSNHTLHSFPQNEYFPDWRGDEYTEFLNEIWSDIANLFDMNCNENKVAVAREKILNSHFTGAAADIEVFAFMPEALLPHAIEWIGRDRLGFSLMYQFVGGYPVYFSDDNLSRAVKKPKLLRSTS
jgi:hypothetical protein